MPLLNACGSCVAAPFTTEWHDRNKRNNRSTHERSNTLNMFQAIAFLTIDIPAVRNVHSCTRTICIAASCRTKAGSQRSGVCKSEISLVRRPMKLGVIGCGCGCSARSQRRPQPQGQPQHSQGHSSHSHISHSHSHAQPCTATAVAATARATAKAATGAGAVSIFMALLCPGVYLWQLGL